MTPKTYITDKFKGYLLGIIIGAPLLAAMYWYFDATGQWGWAYAWATFTAFSLFMTMFYTSWIVPIFNKLSPLEPGSLREKIEALAAKVNFPLTNIMVIDGSKRSTKANAYFSGLGSKKSIVLFDTLIKEHSEEEIVAVLAHEVGHYKKKHIQQGMFLSVIHTGIMLFLLANFIFSPALSQALGVQQPTFHIGLIAFMMLWSPISMVTGIFMSMFSRKNEYEADRYAKENYAAEPLISALKKLSAHNLSNLQPHPLYVFIHYSHPTLLQRIRALK
jgi:STE24 endopeptidase